MLKLELKEAGYFSKTHGIKGHLVLKQSRVYLSDETPVLFVNLNGDKAPYFISTMKEAGGNLIIGLEGLDTVEKAKALTGKTVFAEANYVEEEEDDNEWMGYELVDRNYGVLGKVEGVTDNGQQLLLTLNFKGKEIMLPLVEDFIEKLDEEAKKIHYNAPEGLIDLYLDGE